MVVYIQYRGICTYAYTGWSWGERRSVVYIWLELREDAEDVDSASAVSLEVRSVFTLSGQ